MYCWPGVHVLLARSAEREREREGEHVYLLSLSSIQFTRISCIASQKCMYCWPGVHVLLARSACIASQECSMYC